MYLKKIMFVIITMTSSLFLSNCSSLDDLETSFLELENLFEEGDDTKDKKSEPAPKPKQFNPLTIKAQPIKKPVQKIIPKPKKIIVKTQKTEEKEIEKLQQEIALIDINKCRPDLFLLQNNISNLYKVFIKSNKMCTKINDIDVKKHFVKTLIQHYSSQDVRILNADKNFMTLYSTAIKNSSLDDKVKLNKQILENGCHLLNNQTCLVFKKSLY